MVEVPTKAEFEDLQKRVKALEDLRDLALAAIDAANKVLAPQS